jgi:hypothetical protein
VLSVLTFPFPAEDPPDKDNGKHKQYQHCRSSYLPEASRINHVAVACPASFEAEVGAGADALLRMLKQHHYTNQKHAQNQQALQEGF